MKNLFLFYGDDSSLINESIQEIIKQLSESQIKTEKVEINTLENLETFLYQGSNLSLFSKDLLLEIFLSFKCFKSIQAKAEDFVALLKSISNFKKVILVITIEKFEKSTRKMLTESQIFNELVSISNVVEECIKLQYWQTNEIKGKINKLAIKLNLKFTPDALNLFTECISGRIESLSSELEKLKIFLLPNNLISEDVVKDIYLNKAKIDDIYEAVIFNKTQGVISRLTDLINSQLPLYLLASLQNKLREALRIKLCQENSLNADQISKMIGLHPYKVQVELKRLKSLSSAQLEKIIKDLSEIEFKVKSGALKGNQALDLFVLNSVMA